MDRPEVRYARSGDVSIAYAVVGTGPIDIVFVSGWILSNLDVAWEGSAANLYLGLGSFARLILFDKRGTGMSDRAVGIPDLETRMDDIRAVMDAAGCKRAAILGFSEGGPLSMLFAATYPERTAALVLYGTYASATRADDYPWGPTAEESLKGIAQDDGRLGTDAWMDERLLGLAPTTAHDEAVRSWWHRWIQSSASPGAIRDLHLMNRQIDVRPTQPAIHAPTLVLHREDDQDVVIDEGRYHAQHIPAAEFVALPGVDHGWWVSSGQIVTEVQRFLQPIHARGEWDAFEPERVLATMLFTDIVDSTAKLSEVGDHQWRELLERHHAVVRRQLARFSGREVDTAGDGFFATFDGPARAIRCAVAIARSVRELGVEDRIGIHTGECEIVDGKVGGIAVHIGARVAATAGPSEVRVSRTVHDLVAGSGITFGDCGVTQLKGIPGEWQLFSVEAAPV